MSDGNYYYFLLEKCLSQKNICPLVRDHYISTSVPRDVTVKIFLPEESIFHFIEISKIFFKLDLLSAYCVDIKRLLELNFMGSLIDFL